jgi:hypothetical protein
MSDLQVAFISKSFLRSHWDLEYRASHDSENENALRLALWAKRTDLKETSADSAALLHGLYRLSAEEIDMGEKG